MAVRRKTRSNARRRSAQQKRRFFRLFFLAALMAVLGCLLLYREAVDSLDPVVLAEASLVPSASPTTLPTDPPPTPTDTPTSIPAELTAIALESATPAPLLAPTEIPTATPTVAPTDTLAATLTPDLSVTPAPPNLYYAQPGDTLDVLALRFGVNPDEIVPGDQTPVPAAGYIKPGKLLIIPDRIGETSPDNQLLPDSEVVYSPSAVDFDVNAFVTQAGGYLASYQEYLGSTGWTSGAAIVQRIALENSINPRVLLAILEYRAHWVTGQPSNLAETYYPLGALERDQRGLYFQLSWAVDQLSLGYYGWRDGTVTSLTFPEGSTVRLSPELNAGTVALQYFDSRDRGYSDWGGDLYGDNSLVSTYKNLFGDPWARAKAVEPLLPSTLQQPELILPFQPGQVWSFTGGPHAAWNTEGARAAIDFAPPSIQSGCVPSDAWVTAVASGLVVRSEHGVVILDLDGDGHEQTGWDILYLHLAEKDRVPLGTAVEVGSPIGHPSCEGGQATGTHVHIARKYNGEWVLAGGALPFVLDGWQVHTGVNLYEGEMTKGDQTVTACTCSSRETFISRPKE